MPVKAFIFGTDDLYPTLKPFYETEVAKGNLEIVGHAVIENNSVKMFRHTDGGDEPVDGIEFDIAIISSKNNFYAQMKFLESQGCSRRRIVDGRVFGIQDFAFQKFLVEGVAYGSINKFNFAASSHCVYPQFLVSSDSSSAATLGKKSYVEYAALIDGSGYLNVGNFSSLSWRITFQFLTTGDHNYKNVGSYAFSHLDWEFPKSFIQNKGIPSINIGSDVWIGRGCFLKSTNPEKPLTIGDGAVIASDSVVVKNVPPYAIVGGNPAKIIKYRFPEKIIESLLRIKWWNWDIDKIHENFKYWNDIEKFVSIHDKV